MSISEPGRFLHLGQMIVDLTMYVDELPERCGDVFADHATMRAGGGFNVLQAVVKMGHSPIFFGALGSGPFANILRSALDGIEVAAEGPTISGSDNGYCVAITEPGGEHTFISVSGAEGQMGPDVFAQLPLREHDLVYLGGYSFMSPGTRTAVERFAAAKADWTRRGGRVLFDTGPMVADFPQSSLDAMVALQPIWSVNDAEARSLATRLGVQAGSEPERAQALAHRLSAPVILRVDSEGAWYSEGSWLSEGIEPHHVPTLLVDAIDSNGAGDAHSGVLAAALLEDIPMNKALLLASCAGALSTTMEGPATCTDRGLIQAAARGLAEE